MENENNFQIPRFSDFKQYNILRSKINKKWKLKYYLNHVYFEIFMYIIMIAQTIIIIFNQQSILSENQYNLFDTTFMNVYICEAVLKTFAFGPEKYLQNPWNIFDLALASTSLINAFIKNIDLFDNSSSIIKINRLFRIIKVFRVIRIVRFFKNQHIAILEVKEIFFKMMLCLPAVFNLFPIFIAFFYSYSIIAIDIYNTKFNKVLQENSPYEKAHSYASMNHLGGAMLLLYQILCEASWSNIVYDVIYKFENYYSTLLFFFSFHFIIVFVLYSLLKGVVWDIFTVVESETNRMNNQQMEISNPDLQESNLIEINQQRLSLIFQGKSNLKCEQKQTRNRAKASSDNYNEILRQLIESKESEQDILDLMDNLNSENYQVNDKLMSGSINFSIQNIEINQNSEMLELSNDHIDKEENKNQENEFWQDNPIYQFISQIEQNIYNLDEFLIIYDLNQVNTEFNPNTQIFTDSKVNSISHFNRNIIQLINDQNNQTNNPYKHHNININSNIIMKKAMLKDLQSNILEKIQINHFNSKYKNQFANYKQDQISLLLKSESLILYSFTQLIKFLNQDPIIFFKTLNQIQNSISDNLMQKHSFCQFYYQDHTKNWYYITIEDENEIKMKIIKKELYFLLEFKKEGVSFGKDILDIENAQSNHKYFNHFLNKIVLNQLGNKIKWQETSCINYFGFNVKNKNQLDHINLSDAGNSRKINYKILQISFVCLQYNGERTQKERRKTRIYKTSDFRQANINIDDLSNEPQSLFHQNQNLPFAFMIEFIKDLFEITKDKSNIFTHLIHEAIKVQMQLINAQKQLFQLIQR